MEYGHASNDSSNKRGSQTFFIATKNDLLKRLSDGRKMGAKSHGLKPMANCLKTKARMPD
ncbi:MAG: hypothetical protein HW380_1966 [Magnetococcales bacterium]|nr:hypothetical protein [Magnetococcales bacterium]HIJ83628.1 hypothetical protein [Magnetococcales bacterium]